MSRWVGCTLLALLMMRVLFPMMLKDPRMVAWVVSGMTAVCIVYSVVNAADWLYRKMRNRS